MEAQYDDEGAAGGETAAQLSRLEFDEREDDYLARGEQQVERCVGGSTS